MLSRLFGGVPKTEHEQLRKDLAAYKADLDAMKAASAHYEKWQLETAQAEKWNIPDPSVYANQADLFRKLSWVMLAVDLTASAAALTPFEVARIVAGKEPKDIPNHAFEMLLAKPNDKDSRYEFLYATIAYWVLTGNAYWWLNKKNENSPPDEMWIIPSHMIKPLPDEKMYLKGYLYYPGTGAEILLQPSEIVHFKRFNPFSQFVGLSAIESIAMVSMGDLGMQEWNTKLFSENNARLPGILSFKDQIPDPDWNKIKADTREASKNRELMMLRGAGEGVTWMQNAVSQREMEFLAGRAANQKEIMTALAPGSYTMLSENATQANSVVGRASFNELTVYPKHVLMSEKITNDILPLYGGRELTGNFEDIRVTDKDMELREREAFERVHTVEEVRAEMYGDDPIGDERDKLMIVQINAQSGGIQKPPPQPKPAVLNPVNNAKPDNTMEQPLPETQPEDATANKAEQDLARWRRKAMKRPGIAVPFESDNIPEYLRDRIMEKLPACKTEADVVGVFKTTVAHDAKRIDLSVEMIRQALNFKVK